MHWIRKKRFKDFTPVQMDPEQHTVYPHVPEVDAVASAFPLIVTSAVSL